MANIIRIRRQGVGVLNIYIHTGAYRESQKRGRGETEGGGLNIISNIEPKDTLLVCVSYRKRDMTHFLGEDNWQCYIPMNHNVCLLVGRLIDGPLTVGPERS